MRPSSSLTAWSATVLAEVQLYKLTSKLLWMREGVTLLGITTTPLWIWKRIQSCAGLLPYFLPISSNLGSCKRAGSSGFAQGRSGDPRGLYAVTDDRKKEQYWSAGSVTKNCENVLQANGAHSTIAYLYFSSMKLLRILPSPTPPTPSWMGCKSIIYVQL